MLPAVLPADLLLVTSSPKRQRSASRARPALEAVRVPGPLESGIFGLECECARPVPALEAVRAPKPGSTESVCARRSGAVVCVRALGSSSPSAHPDFVMKPSV